MWHSSRDRALLVFPGCFECTSLPLACVRAYWVSGNLWRERGRCRIKADKLETVELEDLARKVGIKFDTNERARMNSCAYEFRFPFLCFDAVREF